MSHKKFGPDRFSRFDVYWIQTDRQTDKPNLYIDTATDFITLTKLKDLWIFLKILMIATIANQKAYPSFCKKI